MEVLDTRQERTFSFPKINGTYGMWMSFIVIIAIILGTYINLFSYFALLLAVAGVVFLTDEDSLSLLMLMMPFAGIFKGSPGAQSFFTYLILFYVLYNIVMKRKLNAKWGASLLLLTGFLVIQFVISINILRSIKFIANLILIYFAVNCKRDDNKKIFLFYILGVILSSLVMWINLVPNLKDYVINENVLKNAAEKTVRFAGLYADPNYYAVNVIIALCLVVILNHSKKLSVIPSLIFAALLTTFAIMTYSKSAFLMLILPGLMLLYSKIKKRKYIVFIILAIVSVVVLLNFLAGKIEFLNAILSRFEEAEDVTSLTTGRTGLWKIYSKHLLDTPLELMFGRGFGSELIEKHAPHNTYIDLIFYLGIVGTALLVIVFVTLIKMKKLSFKKNPLNYSIWICIAIMYFFLSELFYFDWAYHFVLAILVSKTNLLNSKDGNI